MIFEQGEDLRAKDFCAGHGLEMIGAKLKKAFVTRSGPDPLLSIHQHGPGIGIPAGTEIQRGIGDKIGQTVEVEGGPQTTGPVSGQGLRCPRMESRRSGENFSSNPIQAFTISPHPKIAIVVHAQRHDKVR